MRVAVGWGREGGGRRGRGPAGGGEEEGGGCFFFFFFFFVTLFGPRRVTYHRPLGTPPHPLPTPRRADAPSTRL